MPDSTRPGAKLAPVPRRRALRWVAAAATGSLVACNGQTSQGEAPAVQSRKKVRWRLASSFPRSLDTLFGGAEVLGQHLEAMSGGRFTIRAYPAGELVPGLQVLDAVQQGSVQCGHTASYYFTGKNPALAFDASVPFGLNMRQQFAWLYEGGGGALVNERLADFGVLAFPAGGTGVQMGGWFRNTVDGVADLKGLKMRIPGLGGEVMQRLGATVQVLAGGDIYPALERGAIDATEWVGPYDDEKLGFQRVAKHYYYPGWWEPGPTLSLYVQRRAWDDLPSEYQGWLRAACAAVSMQMMARYDTLNPPALQRLVDAGVQLHAFPQDVMQAARQRSAELLEEQAAADPEYRALYEPWKQFRQQSYRWFGTAEAAYGAFAFR